MNRSVLNRTLRCQSRLVKPGLASQRGKAGGIPAAIRRAMVLWYDIARQGCTNENMAENPILKDLSGNGHDARCYNFAWGSASGIGGYKTDYTEYHKYSERATLEVTDAKIVITNISSRGVAFIETINTNLGLIPAYKIKVSGIPDGAMLRYSYFLEESNTTGQFYDMQSDGEYELPANTYLTKYVGFLVPNFTGDCNITIEQLPLYPHALVSDGVDDYCLAEGLPLLTREKGYTVVARRKWLNVENDPSTCLVSKATTGNGDDGAFMFEYKDSNGRNKKTKSFLRDFYLNNSSFESNDITWQSTHSYNGKNINAGKGLDTDKMALFRFCTSENSYYGQFALYTLLLFNRDLTAEEIEWVKTNLITA